MERTIITEDDLGTPPEPGRTPRQRGGAPLIVGAAVAALATGLIAGHWVLPARAADSGSGPALVAAQEDLHQLQREVDRQRLAASQARATARTARKRGYHAGLTEGRRTRVVCVPPRPSAPVRPQGNGAGVPGPSGGGATRQAPSVPAPKPEPDTRSPMTDSESLGGAMQEGVG